MRWLSLPFFSLFFFLLCYAGRGCAEGKPWASSFDRAVLTIVTQQIKDEAFYTPPVPAGVGAAVVVDQKGYLLAPAPLVREARWIGVLLPDGTQCRARLLGIDYFSEVALLKIKPVPGLKAVPFAKGLPTIGEQVALLGRPRRRLALRLGYVVQAPVSIYHRGLQVPDMIAVALDPSLVGQGPVFNSCGELLGLAVDLPDLHFAGGLYLVPAYRLRLAYLRLREDGAVAWPWLGIEGEPLSPSLAKALGLPLSKGVLLTRVLPGSPAARAGLQASKRLLSVGNFLYRVGDILVSVNGRPVATPYDLFRLILKQKPGHRLKVVFYRQHRRRSVTITLSRRIFLRP